MLSRTPEGEVFVHFTLAKPLFRRCEDRRHSGHIFVRFLNKPLFSDYKVRFDDSVRLNRVLRPSIRLAGFLFFGTIASVEDTIRSVINGPSWQHNPVRFLVLDLYLVAGIDMSSAEAFVRVQRLLATKYVTLVFCGFPAESAIGHALRCVGVIGGERGELFSTFDEAMECEFATFRTKRCKLTLLHGQGQKMRICGLGSDHRRLSRNRSLVCTHSQDLFSTVNLMSHCEALPGRQDADIVFSKSLASSPRRSHLDDAGQRTMAHGWSTHVRRTLRTLTILKPSRDPAASTRGQRRAS